ncbi:MAG: lipoprotein [Betaproteobacteria bacterium]|nr:lipoprotein [Betaproteobacteria bacterium]MDH3437350.1 lipoprotein [Betaproteobacteria bacterium]
MRAPLTLIVLAALLVACGFKGSLYLPPPEKPEAQKPAPQSAPENEKKKPPPE